MAHHGRGSKLCPLCDASTSTHPLVEHVLTDHHSDVACLSCISEFPLSTNSLLARLRWTVKFVLCMNYKFLRPCVLVLPLVGFYNETLNIEH